jgi:hypothetical protein
MQSSNRIDKNYLCRSLVRIALPYGYLPHHRELALGYARRTDGTLVQRDLRESPSVESP